MKLFIDSANIEEIKEINEAGIICGVTTNPSLIAKEGRDFKATVQEIANIVDGPISAEVLSLESKGMLDEAYELVKIHPNIVIKLPATFEGLKACSALSKNDIKVNVTLVFSANQALMAARAGASYVSPFVGRIDDINHDGVELIEDISTIFMLHDIECEIIAASIRNPLHVSKCALANADIATIPYQIFKQMFNHPLTDQGIEKFLSDYNKVYSK